MGRAGSGGSGGGHSGGGHSSMGHSSSGGHRVGSSSTSRRAGSSTSSRSSSYHSSSLYRPPRRDYAPHAPYRRTYVHHSYGPRSYRRSRVYYIGPGAVTQSIISSIATVIIVIVCFIIVAMMRYGGSFGGSSVQSTIERSKLEGTPGFDNNCVIDQISYVDNVSKTESRLKDFYNKTGVQPYIIFKAYDSSLVTDSQKEQWSEDYYDANIDRNNGFLYVYFEEADPDDVGYMTYVNGVQTSSVMDSEAVNIFWANIDKYWVTDMSTDDVIVGAFNDTAKTIMGKPTNRNDVIRTAIIGGIIVAILIIAFKFFREKNRRDKEKAEEDQKILNTPLDML